MKKNFKFWLYSTFGKLDNPTELDWFLISIMSLITICLFIVVKVLMSQ